MTPYTKKLMVYDQSHVLFDKLGMFYKRFPSDLRLIRFYTLLVSKKSPAHIKEFNLLEQQISELIKNAVKHGNKCNMSKFIDVWFKYTDNSAHVIIQDEGDGFQELEQWNEFNNKRVQLILEEKYDELMDFLAFRTNNSDEWDGGNALFAAVEYWNGGIAYNERRNTVAAKRVFENRNIALQQITA